MRLKVPLRLLVVAVDDRDVEGEVDREVREQQSPRRARRLGDDHGDLVGERRGGVDDHLVVQEVHEVRPLGDRAVTESTASDVPASDVPEPPTQVGEPAERPLGGRALHDEVPGEAAAVPREGPRLPQHALVGVEHGGLTVDRTLPVGDRRRRPAEQRRDGAAPLPLPCGALDERERLREARREARDQPAALTTGRAVERTEHADLRRRAGRHRPARDDARVEVATTTRLRHRPVVREAGEHPWLQLGRVRDDELPARIRDDGRPDLLRQLHRTAVPRRPSAGDDAGDDVVGPEAAAGDPRVEPVPPVRLVQAGELLVLEQRCDDRVLDGTQLVGASAVDLDAGCTECPRELDGRVRVEGGGRERIADVDGEALQRLWSTIGWDAGAEQPLEQPFVVLAPPREARVVHLSGGERPCRLRGDQQPERARARRGGDLRDLPVELRLRIQIVAEVDRERAVLHRGRGGIPAVGRQRRDGTRGARCAAQQRTGQPQVPGPPDPHTRCEQPWVHVGGVPDPSRSVDLQRGHRGREAVGGDVLRDAVEREVQTGSGTAHDRGALARRRAGGAAHTRNLERTSDSAPPPAVCRRLRRTRQPVGPRHSWSSSPPLPRTCFSPASMRNGNRFCRGGIGQLKL